MRIEFDPYERPNPDLYTISRTSRQILEVYSHGFDLDDKSIMAESIFEFSNRIYRNVFVEGYQLYMNREKPIDVYPGREPWIVPEDATDATVRMHIDFDHPEERESLVRLSGAVGVKRDALVDKFFRLFDHAATLLEVRGESFSLRHSRGKLPELEVTMPDPAVTTYVERYLERKKQFNNEQY